MSFTMILAVVYAALIGFAVAAFAKKHRVLGAGLLAAVAVLTAVLMYMWIHSPMLRKNEYKKTRAAASCAENSCSCGFKIRICSFQCNGGVLLPPERVLRRCWA